MRLRVDIDGRFMKTAILIISVLLLTAAHGFTQEPKPRSVAELATYRGPDRESVLYRAPRRKGK